MQADKQKVARLLSTARGQMDGVLRMMEEDKYCIDIANQIMASIAILKKANREILKAHLQGCVRGAIDAHDPVETDAKIGELMDVLDKLGK